MIPVLTIFGLITAEHPYMGDIRGLGFFQEVEMEEDKITMEPASYAHVLKIVSDCKENG
ncbi:hypothetical protein ACQKMD_12825 [Viridibacillus sp. NPDC096237]|uniref:hypothetical protein n=1 Tax=Viridibacillus sp. NPDC096237 TaxID=3390721 RepID=UPI003D065E25